MLLINSTEIISVDADTSEEFLMLPLSRNVLTVLLADPNIVPTTAILVLHETVWDGMLMKTIN